MTPSPYLRGVNITSPSSSVAGGIDTAAANPYQFATPEEAQRLAALTGSTARGENIAAPGGNYSQDMQMLNLPTGGQLNAGLASQQLGQYGQGPGSYGAQMVNRDILGQAGVGYTDPWANGGGQGQMIGGFSGSGLSPEYYAEKQRLGTLAPGDHIAGGRADQFGATQASPGGFVQTPNQDAIRQQVMNLPFNRPAPAAAPAAAPTIPAAPASAPNPISGGGYTGNIGGQEFKNGLPVPAGGGSAPPPAQAPMNTPPAQMTSMPRNYGQYRSQFGGLGRQSPQPQFQYAPQTDYENRRQAWQQGGQGSNPSGGNTIRGFGQQTMPQFGGQAYGTGWAPQPNNFYNQVAAGGSPNRPSYMSGWGSGSGGAGRFGSQNTQQTQSGGAQRYGTGWAPTPNNFYDQTAGQQQQPGSYGRMQNTRPQPMQQTPRPQQQSQDVMRPPSSTMKTQGF